tara:strand:+ start:413 stop:526 length:114 start_codon:yes stop_codon:yes gene_type:complete
MKLDGLMKKIEVVNNRFLLIIDKNIDSFQFIRWIIGE